MKNHYLHLVKLGISLKYIKKNQVDDLLKAEKVSFQTLESKLKKEQWISLWHVYIEKMIMGNFVKHGLLDKKLFLVIMDDLMTQAKQKKSIFGPMIAVQKNLLGQKIVERAYCNIILKKMKIPKSVHEGLLQEGFITGDRKLFMLEFEPIEEVAPISQEELENQRKQDPPTVWADESSQEETERIDYIDQEMFEDVSTTEKTKVINEGVNYTEEVCRDIGETEEELYSTKDHIKYSTIQLLTIIAITAVCIMSYLSWQKSQYKQKINEAQTILSTIKISQNWEDVKQKYWAVLNIYNNILNKENQLFQDVYLYKMQCIESFFAHAIQKKSWYLANALKSDYYVTSTILKDIGFLSQEEAHRNNEKLANQFDQAIKNNKDN